jgi:hypothetical protein
MLIVSTVVNRWLQAGQSRRLRMAVPSSVDRESTTRVSADRQNGQYMGHLPDVTAGLHSPERVLTWGSPWGLPVQNLWMINHNLWMTYTGVTTRCGEP